MNFSTTFIMVAFALMFVVALRPARGHGGTVQTGGNVSGAFGPTQNCSKVTESEVLSRRRRFLTPLLSGWNLYIRLTLIEPLLTPFGSTFTQLIAFLPILFRMDRIM